MNEDLIQKKLREAVLSAPQTSGVYLWKDKNGCVIYVGKAKVLKKRLSSYFSSKDVKTKILMSKAHSVEYIQTENEYEALLLENTLIKKYSPKYNINLKDGKTYPVLKLTEEDFPRIYRTRNRRNDKARYFGPFANVTAVDSFLELIKRNYKLRQCKKLKKRTSPCLYFHINRCTAPCCLKISKEDYKKDIDEIVLLLEGNINNSVEKLERKMKEAAACHEFERAARIRDGIQAIYAIGGQNIVEDMDPNGRDYIAWHSEGQLVTFAVLKMRSGKLVGRDLYRAESLKQDNEILQEFLTIYYTAQSQVPPVIFVPEGFGSLLAEKWFLEKLAIRVSITGVEINEEPCQLFDYEAAEPQPVYGAVSRSHSSYKELKTFEHHKAILKMAAFNAKEDTLRRLSEQGDFAAVEDLQKVLQLEHCPFKIEGFDIAHLSGTYPAASLITFKNGNPDKKNYRLFRLKTTDGKIDDYASMREAVARRYTRLLNEEAELPDLVLIDGGIGQVNAAFSVLSALGLDIPVAGLAEKNEEIYLPHNNKPIILPRRSPALRLLQRVRDETHRFANSRNKQIRIKAKTALSFEKLPHIGKKRATLLLQKFGSIEKMLKAPPEAIAQAAKLSETHTKEVLAFASSMTHL